jgi:hypothetical protein
MRVKRRGKNGVAFEVFDDRMDLADQPRADVPHSIGP